LGLGTTTTTKTVSSQPKPSEEKVEQPATAPVANGAKPATALPAKKPEVANTDALLSSLSTGSSVLDGDFKMPSFSTSTSSSTSFFGDDLFGGGAAPPIKEKGGAVAIGLFDDPLPSAAPKKQPAPLAASPSPSSSSNDSFDIFSNPLMGKKEKEERERQRLEEEERQVKAAAPPPPDIFADPLGKGTGGLF